MMSSFMTKLEFPLKPYRLFRLGKLPHICCLLLHWVLSSFVDPYERFVMLYKSRSRTHHPHMHYSYTGGRRKNTPFHLDPPKKCFTPALGMNTKTCLLGFPSTKSMLQVLVAISQKLCCRKETWGYAKVIHKKIKWKNGHKSVQDI